MNFLLFGDWLDHVTPMSGGYLTFLRLVLTLYNKNIISLLKIGFDMICENCKVDRVDSDFLNGKTVCYHCIYEMKIQGKKKNICRKCGKELFHDEKLKKRQRTIFCSKECAQKGHKEQLNNHWTRRIV